MLLLEQTLQVTMCSVARAYVRVYTGLMQCLHGNTSEGWRIRAHGCDVGVLGCAPPPVDPPLGCEPPPPPPPPPPPLP